MSYRAPVPLQPRHKLEGFSFSSEEQTSWLRRHARQSAARGGTRVFLVTEVTSGQVVAYYAWCMAASVARGRSGAGPARGRTVARLALLGVDRRHERRGLGAGLLADILLQFVAVADEIGARALLVHAESESARDYYLHLIPDFLSSPPDPARRLGRATTSITTRVYARPMRGGGRNVADRLDRARQAAKAAGDAPEVARTWHEGPPEAIPDIAPKRAHHR